MHSKEVLWLHEAVALRFGEPEPTPLPRKQSTHLLPAGTAVSQDGLAQTESKEVPLARYLLSAQHMLPLPSTL